MKKLEKTQNSKIILGATWTVVNAVQNSKNRFFRISGLRKSIFRDLRFGRHFRLPAASPLAGSLGDVEDGLPEPSVGAERSPSALGHPNRSY